MSKKALLITMMAMLFGFATQSFAQDKQDDGFRIVKNVKEPEIIREMELATGLVDYGYKNNSAISLFQAAEIFAKYSTTTLKIYDEGGNPIETEAPPYSYDPKDLLKDAKFMAKKDANLLACIENSEKTINKQTKAENKASISTATFKLGAGKTKKIDFDVSYGWYRAYVTSNTDYSDLRLSAETSLEKKEDIDRGTTPSIQFLIGLARRVTVVVENLEDYSTSVTLQLISIIDPDTIDKIQKSMQ